MKKLSMVVLLISLSLTGFKSFSQDKLATYDNTLVNRSYNIEISKGKDGGFILYVDAYSNLYETGGVRITSDQHAEFITALAEAKSKYSEWVRDAKSNNVTDLTKEMPIDCKAGGFFRYAGDWRFQYNVNPTFRFKVSEKKGTIEYLLIVNTGELTASNNEYMKVDGFWLIFKSPEEIDAFTKAISIKTINEFKKANTEVSSD